MGARTNTNVDVFNVLERPLERMNSPFRTVSVQYAIQLL